MISDLIERLSAAGCVAADEEAAELAEAAADLDVDLDGLIERRLTGEPIAWITGKVEFCGLQLIVRPDVYVPRWQTGALAEAAAQALPDEGLAVDLCTGAGAIAAVLQDRRPLARVVASDIDAGAVECARANGVDAWVAALDDPPPPEMVGAADLVTACAPYVPTDELHLLPRDVLAFEPRIALDGGPAGTHLLLRVVTVATQWLRPGGRLFMELGGNQALGVSSSMIAAGFGDITTIVDEDGDDRGVAATFIGRRD